MRKIRARYNQLALANAILNKDPDGGPTFEVKAAALLAKDLMADDPVTFKRGYTEDNAVLTAIDVYPEVDKASIQEELMRITDVPAN